MLSFSVPKIAKPLKHNLSMLSIMALQTTPTPPPRLLFLRSISGSRIQTVLSSGCVLESTLLVIRASLLRGLAKNTASNLTSPRSPESSPRNTTTLIPLIERRTKRGYNHKGARLGTSQSLRELFLNGNSECKRRLQLLLEIF